MSTRLAFAILGGPLAWLGQLAFTFLAAQWACKPGGGRGIAVAVGGAALAIAVGALVAGWGAWQRSAERGFLDVQGRATFDFLAAIAVILGIASVIAVIACAMPGAVLPLCAGWR